MSRLLGEIRQFGYVVDDIEAAMKYWTDVMGVGPWYYNEKVPIQNYRFCGGHYEVHNSVALANSGPVQVELIQTRNDVPSMYREFQKSQKTGLQHIAFWTEKFDEDLNKMLSHGFKVKMSGEVGTNGRFVYFDKEYHPGTVIELSEVLGPKGDLFTMIRESAIDWDGTDPVRSFPNLSQPTTD
ncbi:VOC family protein [Desulfopila sp. IMCC35008]|uniref:VOC family protein n=1 Tax=Desulfopila sp. IMCC35008 TaxID=2653858 RepID=UPI0013D22820|nr:VOC family protein [Desulfopila sp. IMCC35008]